MIYPQNIESKIGFSRVRNMIEELCTNDLSKEMSKDMHFSNQFSEIQRLLLQTNEYLTILNSHENFPTETISDIREGLTRIKIIGTYLTETELSKLAQTLLLASNISSFFTEEKSQKYPELKSIAADLILFPDIIRKIDSAIDRFGNVKDNASPQLHALRHLLQNITESMSGIMLRIMNRSKQDGFLDNDTTPVMRDGRLVIPVAPMYKRKFNGIVHDESATGKTIYIEPAEVVEANNKIRETEAEIKREIIRILTELTDFIRPHLKEIAQLYSIVATLDFIRAKALFAQSINASMPHLSNKPEVEWYHAVHPILFITLSEAGKETIPLNIRLNHDNHILLISGPNAGGKSVCLKTVGIVQYMLQCGILPPVFSNSHFGIFDNMFIDIGDEQSIENELSTYSSHLSNMKYFMQHANEKTLILIDEFGGGTEPQIGGAIAQGILKRLNDEQTFGVITTHYQNLKNFANNTPGILNGAMLYDRQHMKPLFQLSVGNPGSSFAIEIARKIGIPNDVINYAESIVGSDYINMDKYLLDIVRDKKYWENKRNEIRIERKKLENIVIRYENDLNNLSNQRREIINEAKAEAKEILLKSNASIENAIYEIKKVQAEKERTKEIRKQLDEFKAKLSDLDADTQSSKIEALSAKIRKSQKIKKSKPQQPEDSTRQEKLAIGDSVTIDGSNSVGEIMEISGKNAIISFGLFRSTAPLTKVKKTIRKPTAGRSGSTLSRTMDELTRNRQLDFKQEIDVRGMRTDEALQAVSYFIDEAIQFNIKQVRILHGTGYGILRQRIREYLNALPGVKSYRDEHVQFGGAGITVVDLL